MIRHTTSRIWKGEQVSPEDPVKGRPVEKKALIECGQAYDDSQTIKSVPYHNYLVKAGYDTVPKVNGAKDTQLLAIDGIGDERLLEIRNHIANR